MKKHLFAVLICLLSASVSRSATIEVQVSDFQFTPSNFTAVVGDVIRFVWVNGFHTTTSVTVPAGAAGWDSPMNASNPTFDYTVTRVGAYTFQCTPHAAAMTGSFTATDVLPAKLKTFTASLQGDKTVIRWTTLTEENTGHFEIRRSEDGRKFMEICRVPAAGSASNEQAYSFTDRSATHFSGFYYYQLVTVDMDGARQFSRIVLLRSPEIGKASILIRMFPNPLSSGRHLQLSFRSETESGLRVAVLSADGREVAGLQMSAVTGVNYGHLHLPALASGIYLLQLRLADKKETHRLLIRQ